MKTAPLALVMLVAAACAGTAARPDGGGRPASDGAPPDRPDAARADSGEHDSGRPTADGGAPPRDAALPPGTDASAPGDPCASYPFSAEALLVELVGFGAATTGGDPGLPFHVTSLESEGPGTLREALESEEPYWIVFDVEGEIVLATDEDIDVRSNKTVDGRGRRIVIDGEISFPAGTRNVIFSDVALRYPRGFETSDGDILSLRGHAGPTVDDYDSRDFWFHHLDLGRGGDGQLDVRGATHITISFCHMHSHSKSMLVGPDTDDAPATHTRITYHHNWYDHVSRRGPQFAYGLADYFNNLQEGWYEFGAASNHQAQFLSEANIYEARSGAYCPPWDPCPDPHSPTGDSDWEVSKAGLVSAWATDEGGFIRSVGDVSLNDARVEERSPERVFRRETFYTADVEPADDALRERIVAGAGPRTLYCR